MSAKPSTKRINRSSTTQLLNLMDLPRDRAAMKAELKKRVIFDPAIPGSVPDSDISFFRINMGIINPDGTQGDIVFGMDRSFSFGVSENRNKETKALQGYSYPISLYDRDGATVHQEMTVQFIELIAEIATEHMIKPEIKDSVNNHKLQAHHLEKFNPLYYREEKGVRVPGASPTFYPKLLWFKAGKDKRGKEVGDRMFSKMYLEDEVDENGEPLEATVLDFISKKHNTTPAVKIDGIFLGSLAKNIQYKLYEAYVKEMDSNSKRLLKTPAVKTQSVIINGVNPLMNKGKDEASSDTKTNTEEHDIKVPQPPTDSKIEREEHKLEASDDEEEHDEDEKPKKAKKSKIKKVKVNVK